MSFLQFLKSALPEWIFVPAIRANRTLRGPEHTRRSLQTYRQLGSPIEVLAGPFKGMRYANQAAGSVFLPKVLGTYEMELHPWLESMIASSPDLVVDVGAAEGFYAIGMAQRLPAAKIVAYDTDRYARHLLRSMIALNTMKDRVDIRGLCTPEELESILASGKNPLVIVDCEGFEDQLLLPEKAPKLRKVSILVELHDTMVPGVSQRIRQRFAATHEILSVQTRPRTAADCPIATTLPPDQIAAGLDEHRGVVMDWFYLKPLRA